MTTETTTDEREAIAAGEFRERLVDLYRETTGRTNSHGYQRWWAGVANVTPKTVSRWVRGVYDVPGPVVALLELHEALVGVVDGDVDGRFPSGSDDLTRAERDRRIRTLRDRGVPATAVAEMFDLTRQRIHQIENE